MLQKMSTSAFMDSINWRILQAIKKDKDHITFEDYAVFMDLLMNGSIERRSDMAFALISNGNSVITRKNLESFVREIMNFSSHSRYSKIKLKQTLNEMI